MELAMNLKLLFCEQKGNLKFMKGSYLLELQVYNYII